MPTDIRKLEQVLAVARAASFTRAAEELQLTQPALSRSIAAFEESCGLQLFQRGRSGVKLTQAGEFVVANAQSLLQTVGTFQKSVEHYRDGEMGNVNIGMMPLMASLVLTAVSGQVLSRFPHIKFSTAVMTPRSLRQEIESYRVELIYYFDQNQRESENVAFEILGKIDSSMVVRVGHPLLSQKNPNEAELGNYPKINGTEELPFDSRASDSGSFVCSDFNILREATLNSDGVWSTLPALIETDLDAGRLVRLKVRGRPLNLKLNVLKAVRKDSPLSPPAVAVSKCIDEYLLDHLSVGTK